MNKECEINTDNIDVSENYAEVSFQEQKMTNDDSTADIEEILYPEAREVYYSSEKTTISYFVNFKKLYVQKVLYEVNKKRL